MDPVIDIPGLLPLWQKAAGGDPGVRIAVIDGPVDLSHPALRGGHLMLGGQVAGAAPSAVRSEHGTHVTSVLIGVPGSSVLGIAPNCSATVSSIYVENGYGELEPSSQATLALAINQALADGADVINISSGQQTATGQADRILADAVRRCADAGTLIVAAAGNDGCRCVQVPGAMESVLAVGACDLAGAPLPFSNFGDAYLENGILAPGENVKGASPSANIALRSGTSFATPIVTGVVALLLSYLRQSGRDADPRAVRAALLASAVPCASNTEAGQPRCLAGRLDVSAAFTALQGGAQDSPDGVPPAAAAGSGSRFHTRGAPAGIRGSFLQPAATREGTMTNSPTTSAASTPQILGPDGTALRSATGITPSETPFAGPAASAVPGAPPAAAAPSPPAAPYATPQMGGGVFWTPVPVSGTHGWFPGWAPAHTPGVMPSAAAAPAVMPAFAPPVLAAPAYAPPAVLETPPAVLAPPAECPTCAVRPPLMGTEPTGQMAFPIGQLYYDFGREARLDYFVQAIANWRDSLTGRGNDPTWVGPQRDHSGDTAAPYSPEIMARYLLNLAPGETSTPPGQGNNFPDADAIIWTLTIDTIPIYAIKPLDVFGLGFYASMVLALWHQDVSKYDPGVTPPTSAKVGADDNDPSSDGSWPPEGGVTRVSMAGWVDSTTTTRLLNGTVVPTLTTDWRGFYTWDLFTLLGQDWNTWPDGAQGFLERIYNEFRNVGISPQDRALNYSAMNAYNTRKIFADSAKNQMRLDTVEIDRSVICRPESDCWDVTYRFFNPTQVLTQARQIYQYTIDVSDVVPVAVGPLRQWQVY